MKRRHFLTLLGAAGLAPMIPRAIPGELVSMPVLYDAAFVSIGDYYAAHADAFIDAMRYGIGMIESFSVYEFEEDLML